MKWCKTFTIETNKR